MIRECRYVYEVDGKVVGYTMIAPTSKREPYRGVAELSIFVDQDYLRKGIGTASIELHKKCGFRVIGYREKIAKDRFGNWQSTMIMERRNEIV